VRLFTASLGTETNTFSPLPSGRALFETTYMARGGAYGDNPDLFALPMIVFRDRARALGWDVVESLCTFAVPAGPTVQSVYEAYRDEILDDLRRAQPVGAVLLSLHGAMVAEHTESCETDLVRRVRQMTGPAAIVIFKEYPHVDAADRAGELFDIVAGQAEGRLKPRMDVFDCRMIGLYPTVMEPFAGFLRELRALEGRDAVLSISIAHGFPWGDVSELGTKVLVIRDDADGSALASRLGRRLRELRDEIEPPWLALDEALDRAVRAPPGPVVIGDVADNAGGGAPSDSTFVLRRLLERGMTDAALGCLWDPGAVALAQEAGEGATLRLRLGGKLGPMSGDPLDIVASVRRLGTDLYQRYLGESRARMGDSAALSVEGIDVIVNAVRCQTFSSDAFTNLGVDPAARRYVVVKSMNHFRAGFDQIAGTSLYATSPGAMNVDYPTIPYRRLRRPIFPLDDRATAWRD
jgi:microcystin degradation protein MlrC